MMKLTKSMVEEINKVADAFASGKRLVMLYLMEDRPVGYSELMEEFHSLGIGIGSSEVYKHITHLMEDGYIFKKGLAYMITLKGKTAIGAIQDVANASDEKPEIKAQWKAVNGPAY